MSKKKPTAISVEKTIAGVAQAVHDLRQDGESTDRMVVVTAKGLSALTTRVEAAEKALNSLLAEVADLRKPPRTWFQWFNGE